MKKSKEYKKPIRKNSSTEDCFPTWFLSTVFNSELYKIVGNVIMTSINKSDGQMAG